MTPGKQSKDDRREALKAAAADAQGRGERDEVLRLLTELQELDKPEKAIPKKQTEKRGTGKKKA